jgi:hypothetical protein
LVLGLAFAAGAGFFAWQGATRTAGILCLVGGVVLGAGALKPMAIRPLERAWRASGRFLDTIREGFADRILAAYRSIFRTFLACLPRKVR